MTRSSRLTKKRKFKGNRYTKGISPHVDIEPSPSTSKIEHNDNNDDDCNRPTTSSSKTKVTPSLLLYDQKEEFEYNILDLKRLETTLESVAVCKTCLSRLTIGKRHIAGLAYELILQCVNCDSKATMINCDHVEPPSDIKSKRNIKLYDLNIRLVYGMRVIGKGRAAAEKLCGVLNISPPVNLYHTYERFLAKFSETVSKHSMSLAVSDAINANGGSRDISVAIDGSWQKRGHTSLNGILSATSLDTGKVIDIEIFSKFCNCSSKFISTGPHEEKCSSNYHGTSGAMELAGALQIFHRSLSQYNVRYVNYLGDGDSKAFVDVNTSKPYGDEIEIKKIECVGHIQKRMGTRLRTLKLKTKKLPDGTPLGGKNRLTDAAILKLQTYYGLAIRRSCEKTVKEMTKAIWASFYHVLANNKATYRHNLCPKDKSTWCKFNLAKLQNKAYDHKEHFHLPENVMSFIQPVYKDLFKPELLEMCLVGKTQNVNESLNNVIWSYVPKKVFVQLNTLKFGVFEAVTTFNDGHIGKCKLFKQLGLKPGNNFVNVMKSLDRRRIYEAERAHKELQKKIRKHQQLQKRKLEDQFEEEEADSPSYGAGMY